MGKVFRKIWSFFLFLRSRTFAVSLLSLVMAAMLYWSTELTRTVYIRDQDQVMLMNTMTQDMQGMLQKQGVAMMANDVVHYSNFAPNATEVEIQRAFSVQLLADGRLRSVRVCPGETVGDLLDSQGVSLDGNDRINMDTEELLYAGIKVIVERIDYTTRTTEAVLPFETQQTASSLLKLGRRRVLVQGREGVEMTTYSQKLQDGEVIFEQAVSRKVLSDPIPQEELVGGHAAISPLDFGYVCDENGVPQDFATVYRNQKATGYSARAGALTASGRYATPGHVAVNSSEIPYGTKLYITSPDNSFIYGYAIAADTGTGLVEGHTDIDLFYDSYTESVLNGVRYVDIYVLK